MIPEFRPFQKIPRLNREVVITEKIDGSNASVFVGEDGQVLAGSRSRWLTPESDNFSFASWVKQREDELRTLGPGHHFGEWWGIGINRGYGLHERRFSLFNVRRWVLAGQEPGPSQSILPPCCNLVPVLYSGPLAACDVGVILRMLEAEGSIAAPGFMKPEGIVMYHTAANTLFKVTLEKDDEPKSRERRAA